MEFRAFNSPERLSQQTSKPSMSLLLQRLLLNRLFFVSCNLKPFVFREPLIEVFLNELQPTF